MISTRQRLLERRGDAGTGRLEHLQALVTEYQARGTSAVSRLQILANLGNFAYDPINHTYLRALGVIDMCLDVLDEALDPSGDEAEGASGTGGAGSAGTSRSGAERGTGSTPTRDFFAQQSLELAMGALANLSADPQCALAIAQADGIPLICDHLLSAGVTTVASALTALYYLYSDATHDDIATPATLAVLKRYAEDATDSQLRNISWLLFTRVATSEKLSAMKKAVEGHAAAPTATSGRAAKLEPDSVGVAHPAHPTIASAATAAGNSAPLLSGPRHDALARRAASGPRDGAPQVKTEDVM